MSIELQSTAEREAETRAFMLSSIAKSASVFSIAFFYGVFGTTFFEHLFYVWVAATLGNGGLASAPGMQKTVEILVGSVNVVADRPVEGGDF